MSAIGDVARLAGVAKATASRALSGRGYVSEETRSKVIAAAAQIGYVASSNAASLVTGRTQSIGVLIPFISRWFFAEVLEGLEQSLLARGYDMTLYNLPTPSAGRERVFDFFLARKRFDGVISVGVELSDAEVAQLHRMGRPLVGIGGEIPGAHTIAIDDVATARLATEHLLGLGHTEIRHVGGEPSGGVQADRAQTDRLDLAVHSERLTGFADAMRAAGLPTDGFAASAFTVPGGYEAGLALFGNPHRRPTAVFAASDEIAVGLIIAARELGIHIPTDLSVIGIDGHPYAEMFRLTTIEQHPRHQAMLATDALVAALENTPGPARTGQVTRVQTNLVSRASTSAPR